MSSRSGAIVDATNRVRDNIIISDISSDVCNNSNFKSVPLFPSIGVALNTEVNHLIDLNDNKLTPRYYMM